MMFTLLFWSCWLMRVGAEKHNSESSLSIPISDICQNSHLEFSGNANQHIQAFNPNSEQPNKLTDHLPKRSLIVDQGSIVKSFNQNHGTAPIKRFLTKLLHGRPVTVVALGGSVTRGHGVQDPANGWISQLYKWIRSVSPNKRHRLLNHAIPAVTSGYVSACIPELVPKNTDLVILEFTYNDNVFEGHNIAPNNAARRGLERLLRRLVTLENRPGILYFHYWPAERENPDYSKHLEAIDSVLSYYDIPTVSMRDALLHQMETFPETKNDFWQPAPDPKIHPTCLGARWMADLVIGVLHNITMSMTHPTSIKHRGSAAKPMLLFGNWDHANTACVLEEKLPEYLRSSRGWDWVDEGRTKRQHKRGFISKTPGDFLDLEVPLKKIPNLSDEYLIGIGGLISYQHMGFMDITCHNGCSCLPAHFNMLHSQEFSMTGWRYLNLSRSSDEACIVRATNANESSTSEHKLKISSMMLSVKARKNATSIKSGASNSAKAAESNKLGYRSRLMEFLG